jgi:hypothetical protein
MNFMNKGKLYVCPTPIGNLEDITIRVLNTLKNVDLIAAEDTRHTLKLLNYFGIQKPLTSYHEHNFRTKGMILINKLLEGQNIALVSDVQYFDSILEPVQLYTSFCHVGYFFLYFQRRNMACFAFTSQKYRNDCRACAQIHNLRIFLDFNEVGQ